MSDNIQVVVKVRPLIKREKDAKLTEQWKIKGNCIQSLSVIHQSPFFFDHIFSAESSNSDVFYTVSDPIVKAALKGFNGTIFAYGQTSSGKTHTMMGDENDPGIMIMAVRELFRGIEASSDREFMIRSSTHTTSSDQLGKAEKYQINYATLRRKFSKTLLNKDIFKESILIWLMVKSVGYIEIYNEKVHDLLDKRAIITIREARNSDIDLQNKEVVVNTEESIFEILNMGNKVRKAACTKMNTLSSRSHAILRIIIESDDKKNKNGAIQISYLNLVDLAGSERADQADTTGSRLKEGGHINKSLLSLSCVIQKLSEGEAEFINYRDSKLTRILQASLGGNSNTAIICNVTPAVVEETYFTLSFANRAKTIQNKAVCNEVYSDEALMNKMRAEIERLQAELKSNQIKSLQESIKNEIAVKESQFLRSKPPAALDRRQTWHYDKQAQHYDTALMPPPSAHPTGLTSRCQSVDGEETPHHDFNIPKVNLARIGLNRGSSPLCSPKILKLQPCFSPSPNKHDLRFQIGRLENDLAELKEFALIEKTEKIENVDIVKHLEEQLKYANEQLEIKSQEQWDLVHTKLNQEFTCKRCSKQENEPSSNEIDDSQLTAKISELLSEKSLMEIQLKELANVREENIQLNQQLDQVKSAHENEMKLLSLKFKDAKSAQEKSEIMHAESEITFVQYKTQSERRTKELIDEIEDLKGQINVQPIVDFNISKIPIKTEVQDYSYEVGELKSEIDKLKGLDEKQKNEILQLETKLLSILEEKNVLQSEHMEMSTQIMEYIDDMESLKRKLSSYETENETLRQKMMVDVKELEELRSINKTHDDLLTKQKEILCQLETENIEMKSRLTEITMASEQATVESSEKEAMLCKVMTENAHLKEQNAFMSDKLVVLEPFKAKNDILISSVTELETENVKIGVELDALLSKYNSLKHSFSIFQTVSNKKVVALSLVIQNLNKTNDHSNQTKIDKTNAVLTEMTANYSSAQQTILSMEDEIQQLKSSITEHEHVIDKLTTEMLEMEGECKALELSLNRIKIPAQSTECQHPEDQFSIYVTSVLQQFESHVFCQLSLHESLQSKLDTLTKIIKFKKIKHLVDKFIKLGSLKLIDLSDQIDCSSDEIDESIQKLKNKSIELEQENSKQDSQLDNMHLEAQLLELNTKYASCVETLNVVETSLNDAKRHNSMLEANTITLKENECKLSALNEHHVEQLKTLRESYSELKNKYSSLQSDYDTSCSDTEKLQAIVDNNRLVIEQTEEECRTMKASFIECYAKITNLVEETESLTTTNSSLTATNSSLTATNSSLIMEITDLKNSVEAKSTEINDLTNKMEELRQLNSLLISKTDNEGRLLEKLQDLQEKHSLEMEEKIKHIEDLLAQLDVLRNEFSANQNEMRIVHEQKSHLETEVENIKLEKDCMNSQLKEIAESFEKIQCERLNLTEELQQLKEQHVAVKSKIDLNENVWQTEKIEFEKSISELRCNLLEKEQLLQSANTMVASFEDQLRQAESEKSAYEESKSESLKSLSLHLNDLKEKYNGAIAMNDKLVAERKELLKSRDAKQAELKNETDTLSNELKNLKQMYDSLLSGNGNLKHQYNELKKQFSELEANSEHVQNDFINMKKHVVELETKLETHVRQKSLDRSNDMLKNVFELDEQKKNVAVTDDFKKTVNIDRKTRRYSQHDVSRSLMDETIVSPKTSATQTDPFTDACRCIAMDLKIKNLQKTLMVRECIINTLKLEMDNHPLKGENVSLKRKLDERQAENHLLQLNVNHYKAKANQVQNGHTDSCRVCLNRNSKILVNQEVQVEPDDIQSSIGVKKLGPLAHHQMHLQQKYDLAKREIRELHLKLKQQNLDQNREEIVLARKCSKMGKFGHLGGDQNGVTNPSTGDISGSIKDARFGAQKLSNGDESGSKPTDNNTSDRKQPINELIVDKDNESQCPSSNSVEMESHLEQIGALKQQLAELKAEHDDVLGKSKVYKQLAISRRAKIKELEAALQQHSESNGK